MENGRIPVSNNLCGANIKPFATARRAWLFAIPQKEPGPAQCFTR